MHSRIFQISSNPIAKEDYIRESDFFDHWFTTERADYVNEDTDRDSDIDWLKSATSGLEFGVDEGGEYFVLKNKSEFFEKTYTRFTETIDELTSLSMQDFSTTKIDHLMWELKNAWNNEYGFYVAYESTWDIDTLYAYMRYCNEGDKFYIGATIDYHS